MGLFMGQCEPNKSVGLGLSGEMGQSSEFARGYKEREMSWRTARHCGSEGANFSRRFLFHTSFHQKQ